MQVFVDGSELSASAFAPRAMNFGRADGVTSTYRLIACIDELSPDFHLLVASGFEEARHHPEDQSEWEAEMMTLGWPELAAVASTRAELMSRVLMHYGYDVLLDLERSGVIGQRRAIIANTVDSVLVERSSFTIHGRALVSGL